MRDDLLDAQAAVDWAASQMPVLQQRIAAWGNDKPYRMVVEPHPEMGKRLYKIRDIKPLPLIINAEVGAIINSIRSSLDLLACALAHRNGISESERIYFPIFDCFVDFIDPKWNKKGKEWIVSDQRRILEALKPYPGGDYRFVALHQLDILRKHKRLIAVRLAPVSISVWPRTGILEFPDKWPGFHNDAVVAWTGIDEPNCEFEMPLRITFDETALVGTRPVHPALEDLARLAESVIRLFDS